MEKTREYLGQITAKALMRNLTDRSDSSTMAVGLNSFVVMAEIERLSGAQPKLIRIVLEPTL